MYLTFCISFLNFTCNELIDKPHGQGNVLSTPATNGTILQGVTRKSIIEIASDLGYKVEERPVPIEEVIGADEVFCTGTAVGVAPVGSITYNGHKRDYEIRTEFACLKLYQRLVAIQRGLVDDDKGWIVQI